LPACSASWRMVEGSLDFRLMPPREKVEPNSLGNHRFQGAISAGSNRMMRHSMPSGAGSFEPELRSRKRATTGVNEVRIRGRWDGFRAHDSLQMIAQI
jgi:hypothetical protein